MIAIPSDQGAVKSSNNLAIATERRGKSDKRISDDIFLVKRPSIVRKKYQCLSINTLDILAVFWP